MAELGLQDARLPGLWCSLERVAGTATPFLSWAWLRALGAVPEVSCGVRVLAATDGPRVVGLLAVEHWRADGLRVLGLAGSRWSAPDHLDVLAVPGDRDRAAAAIARHLAGTSFDLLDLDGLAGEGALRAAVDRLRAPSLLRLPDEPVPAPLVSLQPGEPARLLPSRNLRQQVGRGLRACERAGGGLRVATTPAEVTALLPVLMDLHTARFGRQSAVFATPARRRFHLEAAAGLAERAMARLYWLEADGQPAALLYALRSGPRLYYYSMGLRPQAGGSPGLTVLGQTVLSAAAEGFEELDLLRGDHEFKLRFASSTRTDLRLRLARPTPRTARWAAGRLAGRARRTLAERAGRPPAR